jgi:hypothetical protein
MREKARIVPKYPKIENVNVNLETYFENPQVF